MLFWAFVEVLGNANSLNMMIQAGFNGKEELNPVGISQQSGQKHDDIKPTKWDYKFVKRRITWTIFNAYPVIFLESSINILLES